MTCREVTVGNGPNNGLEGTQIRAQTMQPVEGYEPDGWMDGWADAIYVI